MPELCSKVSEHSSETGFSVIFSQPRDFPLGVHLLLIFFFLYHLLQGPKWLLEHGSPYYCATFVLLQHIKSKLVKHKHIFENLA